MRRQLIGVLWASVALNVALFVIGFSVDLEHLPLSKTGKVVHVLGMPGYVVSQWLLPGHDLVQVVVGILCSIGFYAGVMGVALTGATWVRRKMA